MSRDRFRPSVTVAAVAERNGRFLIVEEDIRGRLMLNQPAGHLEAAEDLIQAVVREAREETGHAFVPEALLGVYLWARPEDGLTYLRIAFRGEVDAEPRGALDHGIVRTVWLSRDELLAMQPRHRSPLVLRCVDDHIAGVRHPLSVLAALDLSAAAVPRRRP